jgi:hypothetical protein
MSIYKRKELQKPTFLQKLFGINPKYNYIIELNNLFYNNKQDVLKITNYDIEHLNEKYKISNADFLEERLSLFKEYLKSCLLDNKLDTYDKDELDHIKTILTLPPEITKSIVEEESKKTYRNMVKIFVSDGKIDEVEEVTLEEYKLKLNISESDFKSIYIEEAHKYFYNYVNKITQDERISPVEEQTLFAIMKNLNINVKLNNDMLAKLDRFKLYWKIENDELDSIESDINLVRGEKLYFNNDNVSWLELRRVTKRYNYAGPTARIKIAKGIYYRLGSMAVQPITNDEWKTIDTGSIYLTNKRLIFMGDKANKTIRLNRILDIESYSNGIDIKKDSGRSPFLEFNENIDIFSMLLIRLMKEY